MTDFMDSSTEKIASEIIAARGDIWLVWTMNNVGIVSLRGIFTEQRFANEYRRRLIYDDRLVRVWVEKTITNHLYGEACFEAAAYGNGPIRFNDFDKLQRE